MSHAPATDALTTLLPPVKPRAWPKAVGFVYFLWSFIACAIISVVLITTCFPFVLLRVTPVVWWYTRVWSQLQLWAFGARVETVFEEPLPEGPVVFACNHQSAVDIIALFVGLGRRFVFVAKSSVFRYPFVGWHISAAGYIKVDRTNREQAIASLEKAGEQIRAGTTSVAVFPEGTRPKDGSVLPFKKGPFVMAMKAGVPVVPVAIEGSLQLAPKRRWYVCPNPIRIVVGKAIPTEGLTAEQRDDLIRTVRTSVIRQHRRLGGLGGDVANAIAAAGFEGIGHTDSGRAA